MTGTQVDTIVLMKNVNPFLAEFNELYTTNSEFRDYLLVTLMHSLCAKAKGHANPEFPAIVMNFL